MTVKGKRINDRNTHYHYATSVTYEYKMYR